MARMAKARHFSARLGNLLLGERSSGQVNASETQVESDYNYSRPSVAFIGPMQVRYGEGTHHHKTVCGFPWSGRWRAVKGAESPCGCVGHVYLPFNRGLHLHA